MVLVRKPVKAHPDDPMFKLDKKDPDSPTFNRGGLV